MAGLRGRLRAATLGSVAGAVAAAGCALAVLPVLVEHLRPALDAQTGSAIFRFSTLAITVAALAWSFGNDVLPGLRLRR